MKITVVGTGTASLRLRRRHSCVVVETGAETLVFDLGFRAVRGMRRAGIHPSGVDRVFFTHFHGDHTLDVVPFLFWRRFGVGGTARSTGKATRFRPFFMSGPEPFGRLWRWRTRSWGGWLLGGYPMEVSELPRDHGGPLELPGCGLTWAPSDHRPESIAYRLDSDRGSFVYTGDTGYAEPVVELARGAHTLLIDCTFPDDRPFPGHLTPRGVARVASEAGVGRVVLTHLSPQAERLDLVSEIGGWRPLPSPEEARSHPYTPAERRIFERYRSMQVVGDPAAVRERLLDLAGSTGADGLMVTTMVHDHRKRLGSNELPAGTFGLERGAIERASGG